MTLVQHWIGGKSHDGTPERVGDVYNPATGAITKQVAFAGPKVVDEAVAVAGKAFASWRETSVTKRAEVLFRFRDIIVSHQEELARVITEEHGKVHSDALGEVQRGLEVVEFACGISHLQKGEFSENVSSSVDSYSIRQPLGVVAGITPFNFPAMVPMWMYPVAIACGNAFILKPSEKDPSAAILMAELLEEAGVPHGVFNVVHGDKVAVDALLGHPGIAAISSVGSTPVARYIYEQAARSGKRVQALGGAKNHMAVMPDADMDLAADSMVGAAYGSAGERCMAVSAVVAVGEAGDALLAKLRERVGKLRVGPGSDDESEMGPLVTSAHRDKVLSFIETGINEGADLAIDGRDVTVEGHDRGFYLGPCLFDHVTPQMTIYQAEIFGPVLSMLRADDYGHAVELINANPYGNGTAIFTNDGGTARRFHHEVEVGMVGINVPIPVPMAFFSFGGWKSSLFGDSHVYGSEGIRFYTRLKVVTSRWPDQPSMGASLHFPTH
jgi:malonate-semialdehyde dehydrogenase (acetylating)/methylmalonate-semialdehyde dehydrogenase